MFWGYHHLRKHPNIQSCIVCILANFFPSGRNNKQDIEALPTKREIWKIVFLKVLKRCQFAGGSPPENKHGNVTITIYYYGRCIVNSLVVLLFLLLFSLVMLVYWEVIWIYLPRRMLARGKWGFRSRDPRSSKCQDILMLTGIPSGKLDGKCWILLGGFQKKMFPACSPTPP